MEGVPEPSLCVELASSPLRIPVMSTLKFPSLLWKIVNDSTSKAITWTPNGIAISINKYVFVREFLRTENKPFKTENFKSFIRQLNLYGFRKVAAMNFVGDTESSSEYYDYHHPEFCRDHPELLSRVQRNSGIGRGKKLLSTNSDPLLISHPLLTPVTNTDLQGSGDAPGASVSKPSNDVSTAAEGTHYFYGTSSRQYGRRWAEQGRTFSYIPEPCQEIRQAKDGVTVPNPVTTTSNVWNATVRWPENQK